MKVFLVAVAILGTQVVAEPQAKLEVKQHDLRGSSIRAAGYAADEAAAPLIPELALFDDGESPEGGSGPFVPRYATEWKKESDLPLWVQWLIALIWIFMLASLPFIMPIIDGKAVTKTQVIVGGSMLLVLFGGVYLFTNIILFQSIHFKTIRTLNLVECIYFMSQVITTVGYGDITPAKIRGQVFVGLYVVGALFVIAMVISDLTNHMILMARQYKEKVALEKQRLESPRDRSEITVAQLITPCKPSIQPLIVALAVFVAIDCCWVAFFSLKEGEGKDVFQAIYMSVITLSSVGFGWFTPVTEGGMIFASFFFLFGCGALVNVITCFTELMVKMNEWERHANPESKVKALSDLKGLVNGSERVTQAQFLEFSLLQMNCVSKTQLAHIQQAFENLSPKNGIITMKAVQDTLTREDDPAVEEKAK